MSKFSNIKKYRRPLTEIDGKIQSLNERMTTTGLVYQSDSDAVPEIKEPTPDDKMGDLADPNSFTVADQTGSSPDMSQLTATDAYGSTTATLSTPAGSGGLGVISYGSFGVNGGTVYQVLKSDNTAGDTWLTGAISGNGGNESLGAWVNANAAGATTVTWHFYRNPSMADNVFNPIARNVGPGGKYTLWSCSLYVVKNSEFATQAYVPQTLTRYNLGASGVGMPYLFYGGGRGSGAGSVRGLLWGFGNAARSVGGFVPGFGGGGKSGKGFRKFLRAAAKAGIPVGDINQATRIYYGGSGSGGGTTGVARPINPEPPSGTPPKLPDYPDKGLEKMPTIQPDPKPDPKPVPPAPKPTPPKPDPKPTPPKPDPKPTPKPTPPKGSIPILTPIPSPDDLAKIGAPPPPPTAEWGNRSDYFDKYYSKAWYDDSGYKTDNSFVNDLFDKVRYTLDTRTESGRRRSEDGRYIPRYTPEFYAEIINESERLLKNAQEAYDKWTGSEFAKRHLKSQVDYHKKLLADNKAGAEKVAREHQERYEKKRDRFVKGGSFEDYLDSYYESHPNDVKDVINKEVKNLETGKSVPETSPLSKLITDTVLKIPKGLPIPYLSSARTFSEYAKNIRDSNGKSGGVIENPLNNQEVNDILKNADLAQIGEYGKAETLFQSGIEKFTAGHLTFGSGGYTVEINDDGITITDPSYKFAKGGANPIPDKAWGDYFAGPLSILTVPIGLAVFGTNPPKASAKLIQKIPMSQVRQVNPELYQKLQENPNFGRKGVKESFNLNESIEFEQQTGVPIDHVANVMNGIGDALDLLQLCIHTLDQAKENWRLPRGQKRYQITNNAEGSIENPLKMYFSRNTNQYLLTNGNTGEAYDPKQDGVLDKFILDNAIKKLEMGGNVATKSIFSNFRYQPQVEVDEDGNINIIGQLHLFNFRTGLSQTIIGQVLAAFDGMVNLLNLNIDNFQRRLISLYDEKLHQVFPRVVNFDEEIPFVNVKIQIPVEQAELFTHSQYNQPVNESRFQKWKKRTTVEDRFNIGSYEFFLIELASLPELAVNYLRIELEMHLENVLRPANQQMDPKMIKVMSMVNANDVYVDNNFKENEKLFNKLQKSIKKNIDATKPETYKQPPVKKEEVKQRSIKKYLPEHKKKSRPSFLTKKK